MGIRARNRIGFLSGNSQLTTVTFLVTSFTDADILVEAFTTAERTGSPVSSTTIQDSAGAGFAGTTKLGKVGDDRGAADPAGETFCCWVGSSTLTGLSAGTRYYLKLTQGAVVESDCSTCTAPAAGTDFDFLAVSCDRSEGKFNQESNRGELSGFLWRGAGAWPAIRRKLDLTRLCYGIWTDDVGYVDMVGSVPGDYYNDTTTNKEMTGRPSATLLEYDYAAAYCAAIFGMVEDTRYANVRFGRDEYRSYCLRNIPFAFQWGDHEFIDGIGQGATASSANPCWAPGSAVWDALFGKLQPTPSIKSADLGASHWAWVLGDLKVLAPDQVTNGSGGTYATYPYSFSACMGSNQLTDILNAANTTEPFKFLALAYCGERQWDDEPYGALYPQYNLTQFPLSLTQPTEWAKLFFNEGQSPLSLMDNSKTNGAAGVLIVGHGDIHIPFVQRQYGYVTGETPTTGLRADFTSINYSALSAWYGLGTGGNADGPVAYANMQRGFKKGQQLYKFADSPDLLNTGSGTKDVQKINGFLWCRVRGDLTTKRFEARLMTVKTWDETGEKELWQGLFKVGSNRPYNWMSPDRDMTYDIY